MSRLRQPYHRRPRTPLHRMLVAMLATVLAERIRRLGEDSPRLPVVRTT